MDTCLAVPTLSEFRFLDGHRPLHIVVLQSAFAAFVSPLSSNQHDSLRPFHTLTETDVRHPGNRRRLLDDPLAAV